MIEINEMEFYNAFYKGICEILGIEKLRELKAFAESFDSKELTFSAVLTFFLKNLALEMIEKGDDFKLIASTTGLGVNTIYGYNTERNLEINADNLKNL